MTEPEHDTPDAFLAAHRTRRRWALAAGLIGAVAVTGGIFWLVATRKVKPKPRPADAAPPVTVETLEETYRANARKAAINALGAVCDEDDANDAVRGLAEEDDWEGVVIVGNAWLGRCPADENLREKLFKAYEELERWPEAAQVATQLIAADPDDVDYWWWRGQARKETGDVAASALDYRQSIALADMSKARGINIMGYADVAPTVGRACEAAFAMRWYGHRNGGEINDGAVEQLASLAEFGKCSEATGRGESAITLATPPPLQLGTTSVAATIDHHVPYVVIDEAVAAAAGLDLAAAQAIEVVVGGKPAPAKLLRTTVTVGALTADEVEVAVVATPQPAILGLGWWWRFDWAPSEAGDAAEVTPIADPGAL